jgi:effector-binding domain-containing protein
MATFGEAIGEALDVVGGWLAEHRTFPMGPPIVRYRVIDMANALEVEIGFPVAHPVEAADGLVADTLPAGTYAVATYRNVAEGVEGNGALIDWALANGIEWDRWDSPQGDTFACRVEVMLGDPSVEPDPALWDTEVAILVAKASTHGGS